MNIFLKVVTLQCPYMLSALRAMLLSNTADDHQSCIDFNNMYDGCAFE